MDSKQDCPEIGPFTSRPPSTITRTFVAGYSYGGVSWPAHGYTRFGLEAISCVSYPGTGNENPRSFWQLLFFLFYC